MSTTALILILAFVVSGGLLNFLFDRLFRPRGEKLGDVESYGDSAGGDGGGGD